MNLYLEKLAKNLEDKIPLGKINYTVPDLWNTWDYQGTELRKLPTNELLVNPYRFYASLIKTVFLESADKRKNYLKPLTLLQKEKDKNHWLLKSVIYSSHLRTSASWDHDRSFSLDISNFDQMKETGTFIKMLAYLPTLKQMGINTLYLLPITSYSTSRKKGELGSPYAVQSFFKLDENLKDPMTGPEMTLDDEFKAFVEACHILTIRLVIDIIPRTNAINSDLIKDHPDWFYWIKANQLENYHSPYVETIGQTVEPRKQYFKEVFNSENVKNHLSMFEHNPKEINRELFNELIKNDNYLDQIRSEFGLVVAPAFSDWINDPQPPWSDITFFRFYFDHPTASKAYVDKSQAPYILFDSIKSNLYPGEKPNYELFDLIKNIIPYFQKNFGIDGARIDMGHALPQELLDMIIKEARIFDPEFGLIAEELDPGHFKDAYNKGYNAVVGNGFWMEPRYEEQKLKEFIFNSHSYQLPSFAAVETHDTPRIASKVNGHAFSRLITVLNMFIPKMIPFINSGQEVYEVQPMNLGLDASDKDLLHLNKNDLFYGKLALFDKYALHYLNPNRWEIFDHLKGIVEIRKNWIDAIIDKNSFIRFDLDNKNTIEYAFCKNTKAIIIAANTSMNPIDYSFSIKDLKLKINNSQNQGKLLYSSYEFPRPYLDFTENEITIKLKAFELKIIEI